MRRKVERAIPPQVEGGIEEVKYVAFETGLNYGDIKRYKKSLGVYEIAGGQDDYRMRLKNYSVEEDQDIIILSKAIIDTGKGKGKITIDDIVGETDPDYAEMYDEVIEILKKENKLEKTKEAEKEKKSNKS